MYGIYENGSVIAEFAAPLTVRSNVPISVSDTLSLKRQVSKSTAQRWEIETAVVPLLEDANDFLVSLVTKGHSETVMVQMPQNMGVVRKRTSNSIPAATGTAGSSFVNITNNVGLIPKGTFVKFNNHSKIYMLTQDLTDEGLMYIFPILRSDVTLDTVYHRDDVLMSVFYDTDVVTGMVYEDGMLMSPGTIKMVERIV
jgi:hypothetical protein